MFPNELVSLPRDPIPLAATCVAGSLLSNCCKSNTSGPVMFNCKSLGNNGCEGCATCCVCGCVGGVIIFPFRHDNSAFNDAVE